MSASDTTGSIATSHTERVKHQPDYQLLICIGVMVPFGLVMVYSSSFVEGFVNHDNGFYYMFRQLFAAMVGAVGMLITQRIDYRFWRRYALHMLIGAIVLLFLTGFVLPREMTEVNNSRSWIRLGFFSFQPSEFAKLALVVYLASWLSRRSGRLTSVTTGILPFGVILGVITALVMVGRDLGSTMVIITMSALIYFIAGANILHLLAVAVSGLLIFVLAITAASYRLERINAWLDPFAYYSSSGFQPLHALYALASGGIFGTGLGQSRQKYLWLPQSFTDTILAIVGEEFGILGTLFVVGCFAFIAYRGFRIARSAPTTFSALLAIGLTIWIVFQAIINLAVVTTLVPFTGITLPFLSYGGSSLMMSMVAVGILLNISKYTLIEHDQISMARRVSEQFNTFKTFVSSLRRGDWWSRLPLVGGSKRSRPRR
ncbi:MAG: putative lipid II flippase FtsW [Roseiflexaceae bacterium]